MSKLTVVMVLAGVAAQAHAASETCKKLTPKSQEDIWERPKENAIRNFFCDDKPNKLTWTEAGWIDRADKTTPEIARTWLVYSCIDSLEKDANENTVSSAMNAFSNCAYDARRLDRKKVEAEIKALDLPAKFVTDAMAVFDSTKAMADDYLKRVKDKAAAGSPAAKLIEDTERSAAEWTKLYEANKARFDMAYAVDQKLAGLEIPTRFTKPITVGCEPLRTSLREYVAAKKPKDKDAIRDAMGDPVAYVMAERLGICDGLEGRYADAAVLNTLLKSLPYQSGPRHYAHWALVRAANEVKNWPDWIVRGGDGDTQPHSSRVLDWSWKDMVGDPYVYDSSTAKLDSQGGSVVLARVASAKAGPKGVTLTFKKEKWQIPTQTCVASGKVNQWSFSGQPIYQETCKITGWENVELQHDPDTVTVASGSMVKAGQMVRMVTAAGKRSDDKLIGTVVVETMETPKGKKEPVTVTFFGVPVSK